KRYVALLEGVLAQERGIVELPIRMDPENRPIQVVDYVHGKPSVTRYRVLAYETDRTRVEFEPLTGRTHQLRVHAAHEEGMRAPIVGDVLYGGGAASGDRLMLHATELSVFDPDTGRELSFTSETPF
ncbi:MAG: pseudouridine synthase, partial [Phycisphaerales bacterium]